MFHPCFIRGNLSAARQCVAAADALPSSEQPTFNKHIAPLVFAHCADCHRPGEVAPFSLLTYDDVKKRATQIAQVTSDRFMPPWKSVEGHGRFVGERRLTKDQMSLISRWVNAGAPEGDAADLPPTPQFNDAWKLGQPDIVLTMAEPFSVPADGPDIYRNFVLQLEVPAGKYIKALEYRPSNRRVVHHALFASDATDKSRKDDEADPLPGLRAASTSPAAFPRQHVGLGPGREARPLPDGISMPWNNKADLILQLHLHPSGKPEVEQSTIGFFLTDEPPRRSMVDIMMLDRKIDIPPGEAAFRTRDEFSVPVEMEVLALFPHMHMIGRDFKLTANPPDRRAVLADLDQRLGLQLAKPLSMRAARHACPPAPRSCSKASTTTPPPTFAIPTIRRSAITFGEQTSNEMTAALIQLVPVHESDLAKMTEANKRRIVSGITAKK